MEKLTNTSIHFIGQLKEVPPLSERCGDNAIATIFKFKVIKSLDSKSTLTEIDIIVPCPEMHGDNFFKLNTTYLIEASIDPPKDTTYRISNSQEHHDATSFWLTGIKTKD